MLDAISAARDAGYVRGLMVGSFATLFVVALAVVLSWFVLRPTYRSDPAQRGVRQ